MCGDNRINLSKCINLPVFCPCKLYLINNNQYPFVCKQTPDDFRLLYVYRWRFTKDNHKKKTRKVLKWRKRSSRVYVVNYENVAPGGQTVKIDLHFLILFITELWVMTLKIEFESNILFLSITLLSTYIIKQLNLLTLKITYWLPVFRL